MTPEQQRITIAEACGYVAMYPDGPMRHQLWRRPNGNFERILDCRTFETLPDYINSLDAMHEAEKALTTEQLEQATWTLWQIFLSEPDEEPLPLSEYSEGAWITVDLAARVQLATAAQRAEAFLRTIGKWVG